MDESIKIFYSWQSDLNKSTNLNAIRRALRNSSNEIEDILPDIKVKQDEATRGATGSPNIPQTIFSKIEQADIFVCDLTTINKSDDTSNRKVPNPNVLIELGFAIAKIGWNRIIMLFNTQYGSFPKDLPFDIDRHRASQFSIENSKDKNGKANLSKLLTVAIKAIIIENPKKPDELNKINPSVIKRENDLKNIYNALSQIHLPSFDNFISDYPNYIPSEIFEYQNNFIDVVDSKTFHLYDSFLHTKILSIKKLWDKTLSHGDYYDSDRYGKGYKFYFPDVMSERYEEVYKDFNKMLKIGQKLNKDLTLLLAYIRENYLEINIEEVSQNASKTEK